jgi:hypothetical protein
MALLPIYEPATCEAITRFVQVAFKSQDSLFTPGAKVWSPEVRADLYQRFVLQPDESHGVDFMQKFKKQLKDAPSKTIQLAAELLYVQSLTPVEKSIWAEKKLALVETALSWSAEPTVRLPDALRAGFKQGLSNDMGFKLGRPFHLAFLLETLRVWDSFDIARREKLLGDPWEFKRFLEGVPVKGAQPMREILCFFVHPSQFEAITSRSTKKKIVAVFRNRLKSPTGDDDKDLLAIRRVLSKEFGENFHFFQPEIKWRWDPDTQPPANNDQKALEVTENLENDKMKELLEQFGQIILYGPPGTGKTREAKRAAVTLLQRELTGWKEPGWKAGWYIPCPKCSKGPLPLLSKATAGNVVKCPSCAAPCPMPKLAADMTDAEVESALADYRQKQRFDLVVFHPAYEYEQFVGGIEPVVAGGEIRFQVKPGTFLRLCRHAEKHPDDQHPRPSVVLVIDEINRGHLPKLLGELVYALEYRDQPVTLPFVCENRTDLIVPRNLYIIATMNSADRSIGHIDVAIRRRFGLYHLPPNADVIEKLWRIAGDPSHGEQLAKLMKRLNERLGTGNDPSAESELGVGHSYFLPQPSSSGEAAKQQVRMKWEFQVQPLLREYAQLLNLGPDYQAYFKKSLDQALTEA